MTLELTDSRKLGAYAAFAKLRLKQWATERESTSPSRILAGFRDRDGKDDFNDWLGWYEPSTSKIRLWRGTTDPGYLPRLKKGRITTNPKGVGRLREGWWRSAYAYGWHGKKGRAGHHPCLKHRGPIGVERFELDKLEWIDDGTKNYSFNCHRAKKGNTPSERVGDYSHGCLVFASHPDHWDFLLDMGFPAHGFEREGDDDILVPDGGKIGALIIDVTGYAI